MKKHIPTNESVRSMVEMLGVLAIMGVLSIGAVAGYRWAMDKRNANEILNEVRKRAITSSQARISGYEIDLTEYGDNGRINGKYGVVADNAYNGDDRFFTLTVSDIPQGVCDKVVDVNWQMPAAILLDGVAVDDNTVCGEGNNEMLFAFANDLKSGAVAGGEGEETPDPNEEHCWGHGTWDGTSCFCEAGWSGDDCSMTQFCDRSGTCYDCDAYVSFLVDAAECSKCDDSRAPRFMSTHRQCWSCSESFAYSATAAECDKCANSSTPRVLLENGYCALESCGANQFQSTTGSCHSCSTSSGVSATEAECAKCDKSGTPRVLLENGYCALESCGANKFQSTDGYCYSCSTSSGVSATEAECAKCDSSSSPRFMSTDGYCFSCSTSSVASATAAECAKCDDSSTPRVLLEDGYCALESCGANQFQNRNGSCYSCSDSSGRPATEAECAKCDDSSTPRVLLENGYCALESCGANQFQNTTGSCYSCSDSSGRPATEAECAKCDASSTPRHMLDNGYCAPICGTNQFQSTGGYCYSCSTSGGVSATEAECAKCDKSGTPRVLLENGYCALESCGANKFQSTDGYCYSCSTSSGVSATAAECAKCDDSSTPREMRNGFCIIPGYCPEGFLSSVGSCLRCSDSDAWPATEAECAKCDKSGTPRYMSGNTCIKCPTSLSSSVLNTQEKCQSCHGTWDAGTQKCS